MYRMVLINFSKEANRKDTRNIFIDFINAINLHITGSKAGENLKSFYIIKK